MKLHLNSSICGQIGPTEDILFTWLSIHSLTFYCCTFVNEEIYNLQNNNRSDVAHQFQFRKLPFHSARMNYSQRQQKTKFSMAYANKLLNLSCDFFFLIRVHFQFSKIYWDLHLVCRFQFLNVKQVLWQLIQIVYEMKLRLHNFHNTIDWTVYVDCVVNAIAIATFIELHGAFWICNRWLYAKCRKWICGFSTYKHTVVCKLECEEDNSAYRLIASCFNAIHLRICIQ